MFMSWICSAVEVNCVSTGVRIDWNLFSMLHCSVVDVELVCPGEKL
jgi:hypothetical protein